MADATNLVTRTEGSRRRAPTRRNLTVAGLVAIIAVMGTLVYYAVPLYRLFCEVTGFGGTTRIAAAGPGAVALPPITVRFDANVAGNLPWRFTPPPAVKVTPGEERVVSFSATNFSDEPVVGSATFNVTPMIAGKYFNKIQCFCFTEQLLVPGESKEFSVSFFIDPAMAEDGDTRSIDTITLSYTFFNKGSAALERLLQERGRVSANSAREVTP